MKTNGFLVIACMFMLVCYILVYNIEIDEYGDVARFIPQDSLMYLEQRNGTAWLQKFIGSPIGKNLATIDYHRVVTDLGLHPAVDDIITGIHRVIGEASENELVDALLGKHFALALLSPADSGAVMDDPGKYLVDNLLLISEPRYNAALLEFFGKKYVSGDDDITLEQRQYGHHTIERIATKETVISFVNIDGYFLIAVNERQLRRAIDAYDGDITSIVDDHAFSATVKDYARPQRFIYLVVDKIQQHLQEILNGIDFTRKDLAMKELATLTGFKGVAYGSWSENENALRDRITVHFQKKELAELVRNQLTVTPEICAMYSLTTADPMFYYWSNTVDLKHFLPYLAGQGQVQEEYQRLDQEIQEITGKTFAEIVSLLGNTLSLHLSRGSSEGFFQPPLVMFFVDVPHPAELKTIIRKLLDSQGVDISTAEYKGVEFNYWTRAPEDGLKPLYGFWQKRLFIGNSSALLQQIVDFAGNGGSLLKNPAVKNHNPGIQKKNNSVTYINNIQLLDVTISIFDMLSTIVAIEDEQVAENAHSIMDHVVLPLLESAKMYEKVVTRSYFTKNAVVIESRTKVVTATTHSK